MKSQPARPSAFEPTCPSCQEACGRPRSIEIQAKQRTIQYVCDQCPHTWAITTEEAAVGRLFADRPS
jgi:predicted SprT family Zn-dependent metalloprotease